MASESRTRDPASLTHNVVYIATSMDGFIATSDDGLGWLESVPNPDNSDYGFADFMATIDAVVMGRRTFEVVAAMDGDWRYPKPVIVLSSSMKEVPENLKEKVSISSGNPECLSRLWKQQGLKRVYIDGGETVRRFLEADLIEEMTVSRIPVVLGLGIPLFGALPQPLSFSHVSTEVLAGQIVKSHYRRERNKSTENKPGANQPL